MFLARGLQEKSKANLCRGIQDQTPSLPRRAQEIKDLMKEKTIEKKIFFKGVSSEIFLSSPFMIFSS